MEEKKKWKHGKRITQIKRKKIHMSYQGMGNVRNTEREYQVSVKESRRKQSGEGGTAEIVGTEEAAQRQKMWKMAIELNK